MADLTPKPTGLSQPTVPDAWDTYAAMLKSRNQPAQQAPQASEQGTFGDLADSFQRGVAQTVGGDLETLGQLTDSQKSKDMGRAVSAWGDSQTAQMSQAGQEAMNKQFFVENDDGTISAGDAMTDWRSWANQGATLVGQIAANVVGTKGAGLVVRPFARGAAKMLAKEVVTEAAQKQLAKNAVKESIQKGALDDVRKLYAAAPDKAAQNAVINQALSRLGAVGYGAHSAAMASGLRAQQANTEALQHLNGLSNDDLNSNEAYQQAYWDLADGEMQSASPEQIRRAAINQVAEGEASDAWSNPAAMATDFGAGMLEGAVGGLGGVAGKIGKTRAGAAARGALVEGGGEALQAGTTQWAVNEAIREWADESRDPMAGVLVQALTEGVIAGPMGGMAAGINGPHTQHGPAKVTTTPLEQSQFGDIDAWATKMADIMGPHRGNLSDGDIDKMIRQSMGKRGASSEFADMVASRAKAMMDGSVMPGQASDTAAPVQQPLGQMGGAYDEFADTPAFLRSDNFNPTGRDMSAEQDANPYTDVQDALARGSNAQSVDELVNASQQAGDVGPTELDTREGEVIPARSNEVVPAQQRGVTIDGESQSMDSPLLTNNPAPQIGQSDTIFAGGAPGNNQNNSAYTPPILSRNQVDTSLGEQSTRDPRSPVAQAIEQAGKATDSVFGPLSSLRITRRGKPFSTEKEAQLASRKGKEMPVQLNGGGFGVAEIAEVEQAKQQAAADQPVMQNAGENQPPVKQPSSNTEQLDGALSDEVATGATQENTGAVSYNQPADQPAAGVSAEAVTAPSAPAGEASPIDQSSSETGQFPVFAQTEETQQPEITSVPRAADYPDASSYRKAMLEYRSKNPRVEKPINPVSEKVSQLNRKIENAEKRLQEKLRQQAKPGVVPPAIIQNAIDRIHDEVDGLKRERKDLMSSLEGRRTVAAVANEGTIQPGSDVDLRANTWNARIDGMSQADARALAGAAEITTRPNTNVKDQLKQVHPDDLDVAAAQLNSQEATDGLPSTVPEKATLPEPARPDSLPQDDGVAPAPTNTAPASDAGVAVSGSGEKRVTIEPLTDKSIIVKGDKNDAELKDRVEAAWPKAKPLYNERLKGWVFSNKRESVVREALADLLPGDVRSVSTAAITGGGSDIVARLEARHAVNNPQQPVSTDGVMTLDQLKQLRIDTINKLAQQEADNHSTDDRLQRKKYQLDRAIAEVEAQTKADLSGSDREQKTDGVDRAEFKDVHPIINEETEALAQKLGAFLAKGDKAGAQAAFDKWLKEEGLFVKKWEMIAISDRAKTIANQINRGDKAPSKPEGKLDKAAQAIKDKKREKAEKLKRLLQERKGTLNAGIDPEVMIAVAELGALSVADGAVRFAQFVRDTLTSTRDVGIDDADVKPFLKEAYGAIASNPEKYGVSDEVADQMDLPRDVRRANLDEIVSNEQREDSQPKAKPEDEAKKLRTKLRERLYLDLRSGIEIANNNDLKKAAANALGIKPADVTPLQLKEAQEAYEAAAANVRREQIQKRLNANNGQRAAFDYAVDEYGKQPNLDVRTASSSDLQAYSTPAPMALLANLGAGIHAGTTVYEPTAGNGLLLLTGDQSNTYANELDPERADALAWSGFNVTILDATNSPFEGAIPGQVDAVVANPPFGKLRDANGKPTKITFEDPQGRAHSFGELDHVIAKNALDAMKDDGKATLILGAPKEAGDYTGNNKAFLNWLYSNYNVVHHIEVDGDLYKGQGAGWPTQMIVIHGRETHGTGKFAPFKGEVKRLDNWSDIYDSFNGIMDTKGNNYRARPGHGNVLSAYNPGAESMAGDGGRGGYADRHDRGSSGVGKNGSGRNAGSRNGKRGVTGQAARGSFDSQPDIGQGGLGKTEAAAATTEGGGATEKATDGVGLSGQRNDHAVSRKQFKPKAIVGKVNKANEFQAYYQTASNGFNDAVLTPVNMASYTQTALAGITERHGSVDGYVADRLGYKNPEQLHKAFMGLQADAVAMAVDAIERDRAIIIGDQTGVGKGRQAAGVIRYALQQGMTPIFITQKPNLFTDMYDDLVDIGVEGFKPLIMNQDNGFVSKGDDKLFDLSASSRRLMLERTAIDGKLPDGYNGLFLTYSQISSDKNGAKLNVLNRLAGNAILVMDESHTASGGDSKLGKAFQGLVTDAKGVVYLSATYAKRPDNMQLYTRTDMGQAVENKSELVSIIQGGGIGMQTYIAGKLSEAGQMVRRERSFDGISITNRVLPDKNGDVARQFDDVTEALRAIQDMSTAWRDYVESDIAKKIQIESGMDTLIAGNQADTKVNVTLFSSVIHNYIAQLSLGLKAKQTAQLAIESIKQGKRPVIALENTMGSALKDYMDRNFKRIGDTADDLTYGNLLKSIADGVLAYRVKEPGSTEGRRVLVTIDNVDSPYIKMMYNRVMDLADNLNVDVPASPIDAIRHELTRSGYSVAEITGRSELVDYGNNSTISRRPADELDRRSVVDRFNSGKLDVLILNQAGSTGLSIHASERFDDQNQRHMIVAQPSLDINTFMQMLGRVNRTGQVKKPTYDLAWLDLPSEMRPAAVLSRKMTSLNANTSGNTDSATSIESVDLLNVYGDQVVTDYVKENYDQLAQYSSRLVQLPDEDAAVYFLGKLAVMPVKVQKQVLEQLEENYRNLIEYLDATGQNELNMTEMDLDAKPVEQLRVSEGRDGAGVFSEPTYVTKVDVKAQGKAPTWDEVKAELEQSGQDEFDKAVSRMMDDTAYEARLRERIYKLKKEIDTLSAEGKKTDVAMDDKLKIEGQLSSFADAKMEIASKFGRGGMFSHGSVVRVKLPENETAVTGVVVSVKYSHGSGNPASQSKWKVGIMLADRVRKLPLALTQADQMIEGTRRESEDGLKSIFDRAASLPAREHRYIMTGNLIEAQSRSADKGRIVPFTTNDGRVIQGMLMPKKFKPESSLRDKVSVTPDQAFGWLDNTNDGVLASLGLTTNDGEVTLRRERWGSQFTLEMPKAVSKGKKYWGNPRMVEIIGEQAVKGNGKLEIKLSREDARRVTSVMAVINPLGIYNQAQISDFNQMTGKNVPTFQKDSVKFRLSKHSGAPLEQHTTTKELELFVKGWQKRYKGGAGVRILVGDTQADLNEVLRMVGAEPAPKGQQVEAAYLPGYKTLLLNASAIKNAKHARQILQHEVLAHHGLREVVGDDAYISIIEAVKRGKNIAAIKQAYYDVAQNYSDMHPDVQAEEVFAHWAENQPERGELSLWWRGIVRRVKDALRAVGLLGERTTEEELGRVFDAIVTGMKNGRKPGRRVMEAGRRDFDTKALAKLASTVTTDEQPAGINVEQAQAIADAFMKAYNGNIPLEVQVANTQEELYGPDATIDNIGRVKGAYHPAKGVFTLAARNLSSVGDAIETIRHEVLGHYGLNTFTPVDKRQILDQLIGARDTKGPLGDIWAEIDRLYAGKSVDVRAEEVFSRVVEQEPAKVGKIKSFVDRLLQNLNVALRKAGLVKGPMKLNELRRLARYVAEGIRSGRRQQQTFPTTDDALFRLGGETADDHLGSAERKLNLVPPPDVIDRAKGRIEALRGADKEQVKSWWQQLIHKANTNILDGLAPIKYAEEAQGKLDARESGYAAARLATGSSSTMQATLLYGLPEWNDGVIQKKAGTGEADSLLGIFEGLGKDLHSWLGWMAGHRAERLMAEGRENLLTSEEIQALKQQGAGKEAKFDEAKAKWNRLNGATLDLAQEAGLMTKEQRDSLNDEWYIPFFRESEDGDVLAPFKAKGIANQSAGIKKLKGGTANVNDLLENIFTTTGKLIDASMKNMAAQKVVWNLAETDLIEVVPKPNLMDMRASAKPGNQMMWVKMDGEDYLIKVHDADLFRAMTMIDQKRERGPVMQLAMKAKHLLTAGVTASPEFMLRNFMRDAVSAWAINEDGFTPLIDSIKGVKQTLKMNGGSIDMMFSGASFLGGYVSGNNPEAMASSVRKALRAKGMNPDQIDRYEKSLIRNSKQAWDVLANVWRKYERVGEAIENGSREAVYSAAIKAGKSHAQAAFEAKDLMDFSMLGSSKVMQFLVDVLPFFNARMQGLGKLGRAMRDNPAQIARRGGMIAAASLALLALNWDDDRYDDLPDWDKDLNWHFFLGDQHYRIPKPFEIGLIFGTLPERMTRAMGGKDTMGKFGQVVARNMLETFAINPIPQVVKPISEAYFNYDPFRGGPIDNLSDLNVLPEARYDDRTSLLMRELGELTGWSPKKLQHIVEGYTGTMGAYVLAAGDALTRAFGNYGSKPSFRADEIPLLRTVYQGSAPARSSQAMTDFYKLLEQVNSLQATINRYRKEGRYEDATELQQENRQALAGRQQLNAAQKQFRALRNEMQLIMRDRTLTAEGKRERIDRLLARRNNLASQMIHRFEMQ